MIVVEHLTVEFGGVKALNDLSVELVASVVGVIGPNGAGKTTLLNALSGFVAAAPGSRVHAFDTDLLALTPAARARWGLRRSFQAEQIVEELSVAENVLVMLDSSGLPQTQVRAALERALHFTGLAGEAGRSGASLNAFERRLVEIARAVAGRPRVVLLDEPGGGLSGAEVDRLCEVIGRIHPEFGAITVLIDHDVELIVATCVDTLVLDFGMLIAHGPTAEALADPRVKVAYLGEEQR